MHGTAKGSRSGGIVCLPIAQLCTHVQRWGLCIDTNCRLTSSTEDLLVNTNVILIFGKAESGEPRKVIHDPARG